MPNQKEIERCRLHDLPADWKVVPLGQVAETEYGISETASDNSSAEMIGMKHLVNGSVRFEDLTPIDVDQLTVEKYRIKERDLLFNRTNSFDLVGKTSIAQRVPHNRVLFASYLVRIHLDEERALPEFVNSFLNSDTGIARIKALATPGVSQYNLNPTSLRTQLFVPLPPLPEQQKIAAILSTWDRAIELTEKLIAAKQKRKQALMQQLLSGKVRLPQFQSGKKNSITEFVRVPAAVRRGLYPPSVQPGIPKIIYRPDGWAETTMDELLQIEQRPIELANDTEYQLVVAKRNRGGIEPRERLLGRNIKTPSQFEVRSGDFVISKRQIIHGACGVVPESLDRAIVSNEYSVCTVNRSLNMEFLKYLSHTLYFQQTCFHASVGVALEKMIFRLEQWLKFPFLIPPIEEQKAIVSVLVAMDKELDLLTERAALLSRQKKGLMQQLLTGKIRVNVDGETVKE